MERKKIDFSKKIKILSIFLRVFNTCGEEEYNKLKEEIKSLDITIYNYFCSNFDKYYNNIANRPSNMGLWNTNNCSESLIRSIQYFFNHKRGDLNFVIKGLVNFLTDCSLKMDQKGKYIIKIENNLYIYN